MTSTDETGARVYFADEVHSRATLSARGGRAAAALANLGVTAGDVVGVMMRNEPAYLEVLEAVRVLGGQRLLMPWHLRAPEVAEILAAASPRVLVIHTDLLIPLWPVFQPLTNLLVVALDPPLAVAGAYRLTWEASCLPLRIHRWADLVAQSPPALATTGSTAPAIALTSGSTGRPKLISWTRGPPSRQWARMRTVGRPPIKVSVLTAPLHHGAQFGMFMHASHAGADLVLLPKFDAEGLLAAVERHRAGHLYAVPAMFVRLLKLPKSVRASYDVSSLNYVVHTGAPCPPDVKRELIAWLGPIVWETYGCSETSAVASISSDEWLARPGSVGRPSVPIAILDEHGRRVPVGQPGSIHIDVSEISSGTVRNPGVHRRLIAGRPHIAPGDVGYLDDEGYLYLVGRADGLINTGRVKVYPREIEHELLRHPDVRDCAVFAVPDAEFGQMIGAAVDTRHTSPQDLRTFLAARLSEYKIPKVIVPMRAGLRTEDGKLNQGVLMDMLGSLA